MLLKNFIDLFLDSAPWLLLGLILAGLLKVFVPMAWMQKQLGGHGFKTVVKAALLGAPLPLCSCGVLPGRGAAPLWGIESGNHLLFSLHS